jgi:hypothetical protein
MDRKSDRFERVTRILVGRTELTAEEVQDVRRWCGNSGSGTLAKALILRRAREVAVASHIAALVVFVVAFCAFLVVGLALARLIVAGGTP